MRNGVETGSGPGDHRESARNAVKGEIEEKIDGLVEEYDELRRDKVLSRSSVESMLCWLGAVYHQAEFEKSGNQKEALKYEQQAGWFLLHDLVKDVESAAGELPEWSVLNDCDMQAFIESHVTVERGLGATPREKGSAIYRLDAGKIEASAFDILGMTDPYRIIGQALSSQTDADTWFRDAWPILKHEYTHHIQQLLRPPSAGEEESQTIKQALDDFANDWRQGLKRRLCKWLAKGQKFSPKTWGRFIPTGQVPPGKQEKAEQVVSQTYRDRKIPTEVQAYVEQAVPPSSIMRRLSKPDYRLKSLVFEHDGDRLELPEMPLISSDQDREKVVAAWEAIKALYALGLSSREVAVLTVQAKYDKQRYGLDAFTIEIAKRMKEYGLDDEDVANLVLVRDLLHRVNRLKFASLGQRFLEVKCQQAGIGKEKLIEEYVDLK